MNLLFINPPSPDGEIYIRDTNRSGRRSHEKTIWPQTGLAMFAAMFPQDCCKIIDCIAEKITYKRLFEMMKEFKPDWVITNPISSTFTHDIIVCHYAKSLYAKTVIISPLAKVLKSEVFEKFKCIDHIIEYRKGDLEPEYVLKEIITKEKCESGLFYNFLPARQDLLPRKRYTLPFIGKNFTFVIIGRGCPYRCIYCRQNVSSEGQLRQRSVESVIEEIRKYELKNIAFHADTFTLNKLWVYELCKELKKLPFKVRWICNSRVDTVDPELLHAMKSAGCWMICYGVESGDDVVLALNKKGATCDQAKKAIKWTKEAGIKVWAYFMLGLYGDTRETMERTIRFACELDADIVNFAISAPYHGTEWYDMATRNKWLSTDEWESFDQNYSAIVDQPNCPGSLVKEMQRNAYLKWFISWKGIRFFFNYLLSLW